MLYFWIQIPTSKPVKKPEVPLSVLIPYRNEAENLPQLISTLEQQTYSPENLEYIFINDHSTDKGKLCIEKFKAQSTFRVISLDSTGKGKKSALVEGLRKATGEVIVTTDADCTAKPEWLKLIGSEFTNPTLKMLIGPVVINPGKTLFSKMQSIEFSSLIGSGAALLQAGYPTLCNGANLAYRKKYFPEVGGFEGNMEIASGDDEFLMHKFYKKFPGDIHFLKNQEAVVSTSAQHTLTNFFHQRSRWASKWSYYQSAASRWIAVIVFGFNAGFVLITMSVLIKKISISTFLCILLLKILVEFLFLQKIIKFSRKPFNILAFGLLEIIYPFYVVFFGILSKKTKYQWKERTVK